MGAVVAAGLLPFPSPVSRNGIDGLVAPLCAGLGEIVKVKVRPREARDQR